MAAMRDLLLACAAAFMLTGAHAANTDCTKCYGANATQVAAGACGDDLNEEPGWRQCASEESSTKSYSNGQICCSTAPDGCTSEACSGFGGGRAW